MRSTWLVPALLGTLLGACRTTERRQPVQVPAVAKTADPARAWEAVLADEVIGLVVFFENPHAPTDAVYFVRNVWQQDLGLVDRYGRAYRYFPHHKQPAWIGTGTLAEGAARILDTADCQLVEVPFPIVAAETEATR